MKKFFKLFAMMAFAAIALVSCSKNDQNLPVSEKETIHIDVNASVQDLLDGAGTKTYIGTYEGTANTIIWGTGEYMKIAVSAGDSNVFGTSNDASADVSNGKAQATFGFDLPLDASLSSFTYMGVYPASAVVESSNTNVEAYKVVLPAIQNATADSYDPAAYIMVAKPTLFNVVKTSWMASYRRATALNKITLTNIPEDIVSVEFTAPEGKYMAGRRYINLTTGESGQVYNSGSQTETIEVKANLSGTNKVVWFTSWGIEIPAESKFKIVAKSATKTYTRELTAKTKGINFKEGYLNTLQVDMTSATVADIDDLSGNYLILGFKNYWNVMAAYKEYTSGSTTNYIYDRIESNHNSLEATELFYDDFSDIPNIEDYIWIVAKTSGGYTFQNEGSGNFLALSSNTNAANESETPEAFSLTISDTKEAVIRSNTYESRVLRYNSSSPRFAFYNGTQEPVYMIKAVSGGATPRCADPEITYNSTTKKVTITCTTSGATIAYTIDGSTPVIGTNNYSEPFEITSSTTIKAIAGGKSGYRSSEIVTEVWGGNDGSEEHPYTASEANAKASTLGNSESISDVYVKGIISKITTAYNSEYNNITFNISEDGLTTGVQFQVYRATATSADVFEVGDAVLLKGTLVNYNGNTPQLTAGATGEFVLKKPRISPDAATFPSTQVVTITAAAGAKIYYTLDGTTPTTESTEYTSAFTISETKTIKAIAVQNGFVTGVISKQYTKSNAKTVTYTVASKTTVTTSGTAPAGSSASYEQTYNTVSQATKGNTFTLTLSGFGGKTIKGASVSVHSNAKAGSGYLSLVSGSNTLASIGSSSSGVTFSNEAWNGSYTTSYVTKELTVTETTIADGGTIILTRGATANSLFFESLTLSYED